MLTFIIKMHDIKELNESIEEKRIQVLRSYDILDTPPDGTFDHITRMAAEILDMPIAIVSLVDTDRIWFKSKFGIDVQEIEREPGLCASAILSNDIYLVEDAKKDIRTLSNPLVAGSFGLRFYSAAPLTTRDGYNLGTLCVIDKRARKFSDKKKKVLRDLADLVVQQMELRLEARTAVKHHNQLLNITAHDLKNPLSIMPLLADLIIHNKDNPKAIDDIAQQIKSAGKRMTKIVNDILDAAREDTGRLQLRLKPVNMVKLVKGVVASNSALAKNKDQVIKLNCVRECSAYGDQQRIIEIVDNLINNAIKYSPYEKEIHVSLSGKNGMAVLEIKDYGPGLTKDDLKNLFRKFTSLSAQPTGGETSSGLGLSIVKHLVDAHRGKIYAKSDGAGKGTAFIVELPLVEDL